MAFPTGWGRKQAITFDADQVSGSGSHTNFPVAVTLDHLDSEIVDAGSNSALNGGGDLRFSSDSAGTTQLACDVARFVTDATEGNRRCVVWVKIPSLSTSTDTTIYVWYKKAAETQPASDSTYGSEAVWSDYECVLHLNENDSNGPWADSTGNGYDATLTTGSSITSTETGNPLGDYWLDFTTAEILTLTSSASMLDGVDGVTLQMWVNLDSVAAGKGVFGNRNSSNDNEWYQYQAFSRGFAKNSGSEDLVQGTAPTASTTYLEAMAHDSTSLIQYSDGVSGGTDSTIAVTSGITGNADYRIGTYYAGSAGNSCDGRIGEVRARKDKLSADWLLTEANNVTAPATFATAGTPEAVGGGVSIPVINYHLRNQGIM